MSYLCEGSVESVYASGTSSFSNNEDCVSIILNFSTGEVGTCELSWLSPIKVRKLSVSCTQNFADLDLISQSVQLSKANITSEKSLKVPTTFSDIPVSIDKSEPLKLEIIDFLSSIISNKPPLVTGKEAASNIRLAEAALQSLKTNKVIKI